MVWFHTSEWSKPSHLRKQWLVHATAVIMCGLKCLIVIFCGEMKPAKSAFLQIRKLCSLRFLISSHLITAPLQMSFDPFLLLKKHTEATLRPCFCWLDSHKDILISLPTTPKAEVLHFPASPSVWALTDLSPSSYAILPSNLLEAGQLIQKLLGTMRDRHAAQSRKLCSVITQSYRLEIFFPPWA